MIWKKVAEGRFESIGPGTKVYVLSVEDFGLQVKHPLFAVEVRAKSSGNVQIGLSMRHGATPDTSKFATTGTAPIPIAPYTGATPNTLFGTGPDDCGPYLLGQLEVGDAGALEWIDAAVYVGGMAY